MDRSDATDDDPAVEAGRLAATQARWRRIVLRGGAGLLGLVVVVVVASRILGGPDEEPGLPEGLLTWPARGTMVDDAELIAAAEAVWRSGATVDGTEVARPDGEIYVLWADRIGAGRVVIMEAIGADGEPYVAQATDAGDPAVLGLNTVEPLPAELPVMLAVTYEGNIDLPSLGLAPGRDSALIQLLPAPAATDDQGVWRYRPSVAGSTLEELPLKPTGMSRTFLQLDTTDPAGTPVVLTATVEARAGVAGTIAVHAGRLVPTRAEIALVDDPDWGPSGRVDGEEYTALNLASAALALTSVHGFVVGTTDVEVEDAIFETSLVVLWTADDERRLACVVVDHSAEDEAVVTEVELPDPAEHPFADQRVLGGSCRAPGGGAVVTVAAARPGAGQVVIEAGDDIVAGPAEVLAEVIDRSRPSGGLVARLVGVDGAGTSFTVPPLGLS